MKALLVVAALFAWSLVGCQLVDGLLGVTVDPVTGEVTPGTSIAQPIASAFGGPIGAAAVGLATTLWAMIRGRQWKKVATVGVTSIAKIREAMVDGKIDEQELLDILRDEQDGSGTRAFTVALMKAVEAKLAKGG